MKQLTILFGSLIIACYIMIPAIIISKLLKTDVFVTMFIYITLNFILVFNRASPKPRHLSVISKVDDIKQK